MRLPATAVVRVGASSGAVALLATGALACGEQKVDANKAKSLIESAGFNSALSNVVCPKNVTYKKDSTFECEVNDASVSTPTPGSSLQPPTVTSKNYTVTVHMIGDGKLKVGPSDLHEVQ